MDRELRVRIYSIPLIAGLVMLAVGSWLYWNPGQLCGSTGPNSGGCPVPASYYALPDLLIFIGGPAVALGITGIVTAYRRAGSLAA